jgi:hypothetical protein
MMYYQSAKPRSNIENPAATSKFGVPYFSISVSLNVLLTLMIVIRLSLHNRNIRICIGTTRRANRLYTGVVTMLTESCALYAVSSVLYVGPWSVRNYVSNIFFPVLVAAQVRTTFPGCGGIVFNPDADQVIAPFLVILRVANQRALTNGVTAPVDADSIRFRSREKSTGGTETIPDGHPMNSMGTNGETPSGHVSGTETTIDEVPS